MPTIASLLIADGADFVSRPVPRLTLTLEGIGQDRHAGPVRAADARTPWHPRGTPIANTRQLSIVSREDCEDIALLLGVEAIDPALLGANVVTEGLPELSLMMPGSRLRLPSGATIFVTEQNAPCRHPAEKIAEAHARPRLAASFARAAIGRRGVVGLVERGGPIAVGDDIEALIAPGRVTAPKLQPPRLFASS